MLEARDLKAGYGPIQILHGVTLTVHPGEAVAVLGPNGAGKSTLLRTLSGHATLFSGTVRFQGTEITAAAPDYRVRLGLLHVLEGRRVFAGMTVEENLVVGAHSRGRLDSRSLQDDLSSIYSLMPRLAERRRQRAGTLSGGEQQMLAIGRALMAKPRMLMLDEPSLGLAPGILAVVVETLRTLHEQGISILIVEQNPDVALDLASRCLVLETGIVALEGPTTEVRDSAVLSALYLGGHVLEPATSRAGRTT